VSVYPNLLHAIERIVFMGGGIGIGNRSAVAGWSRPLGVVTRFFGLVHLTAQRWDRIQYSVRS
jgi:hypothetical protein